MSKVILFFSIFLISITALSLERVVRDNEIPIEELNDMLLNAVYKGNLDSVKILLQKGANANATDLRNISALIYAVQGGYDSIVEVLAENGADLNHKGYLRRTALFEASRFNYFHIAEYLVLKGAEINSGDIYGNTALFYAVANANFFMADMLIFYGANVNHKNNKQASPLHIASWYGQLEIAGLLIEAGSDVDAADRHGNSPLIVAVMSYNIDMAWYLIESGADIVSLNNEFHDIFSIAAFNKDYEMFDFLASYNVKPEDYPHKYKSPAGISYLRNDKELKRLISKHKEFKPKGLYITHFVYEPTFHFSNNEFMVGAQVGFFESRLGFNLLLGYESRIDHKKVLVAESEDLSYQYWEKRRIWHLALNKEHSFYLGNFVAGFHYGIKGAYTYGSYRGSENYPESRFLAAPFAGVFIGNEWFRIKSEYEYFDIKQPSIPKNRYSIGVSFKIPIRSINFTESNYSVF
ncbi:MAG: ankyrin repeat domain-containing protein [Bacteroidetes bacterium]|nr:ankyrin repeat domain-containing protein [Bacteroidota bacterium]